MEKNQEKTVVKEPKVEKVSKPEGKNSTLSVISFIFGLFSIAFFYFTIVSVPFAILAIVLAVLDKKVNTSTLSVAGLVMGIITLALYVIVLFTCLIAGFGFEGVTVIIESAL